MLFRSSNARTTSLINVPSRFFSLRVSSSGISMTTISAFFSFVIILLSLDLSDTQRLLDIGQKPRLYPRVRYDAAIIYGLEEKMTLEEMNSFLDEIGEEVLL